MALNYIPPLIIPQHGWISVAAGVVFIVLGLLTSQFGGARLQGLARITTGLGSLLAALGVVLTLMTLSITSFQFYAPFLFYSPWSALAALVLGCVLFTIRKVQRGFYGLIEIVGALSTIVLCAVTNYGSESQRASAFLGAIYFLVRGLDNAEHGKLHRSLIALVKSLNLKALMVIAFVVASLVFVTMLPSPDADVFPPYMSGQGGARMPVPASLCGQELIVCDALAWQRHDQLKAATPNERARYEREALRRYQRWASRHGT